MQDPSRAGAAIKELEALLATVPKPVLAQAEEVREQRRAAAANCAKVAWMYAATGAASALGLAYHRVARR